VKNAITIMLRVLLIASRKEVNSSEIFSGVLPLDKQSPSKTNVFRSALLFYADKRNEKDWRVQTW